MYLPLVLAGLLLSQAATPAQQVAVAVDAGLIESAKAGDLARVRDLLSKGTAVDTADRRGLTPLMWASAGGYVDTVRRLLESGAAVDRRAHDGTTALMLAASNGFVDVTRALLVRGANVAAVRAGLTARGLAQERGHPEVVALIERAETLGARLLQAAAEGNDTVVRQLIVVGAPFNIADARGETALMMAARNGDLGMLQSLLTRGADVSARDNQGRSVIEWAEPAPSTGKYVLAFLLDRGVSRGGPAPAPTLPQSPQVTASLKTLAATLARIPPASLPVRAAQQRATAALSRLVALSAKWPANSPDDYRDNLAEQIVALEEALRAGDIYTLTATVEAVAEDLEIKLEHCTMSGGALGGSIVVRVRTVDRGEERKSWQVFYMPRIFEAAASASPDLFPQLSSPTEETLVPGRYVMWVRDPATARLGERTVVRVGEGRKELLLDLPVPSAFAR